MRKITSIVMISILAGCASEQQIRPQSDYYSREYQSATIYNAANLTEAQNKANRFCNGKAYDLPELHNNDLKKQQAEKNYRWTDSAGWHFVCTEIEAMRIRGMYGDQPSQARYEQLNKIKMAELDKQSQADYERRRERAKAPGFTSSSKVLPGGTIMTESYGNGIMCHGVSDENGAYTSCDDVRD